MLIWVGQQLTFQRYCQAIGIQPHIRISNLFVHFHLVFVFLCKVIDVHEDTRVPLILFQIVADVAQINQSDSFFLLHLIHQLFICTLVLIRYSNRNTVRNIYLSTSYLGNISNSSVFLFLLLLFFYQRPTVNNDDRAADLAEPSVSPPTQLVICLRSAVSGTGVSFSVVFLSGVAPILCSPSYCMFLHTKLLIFLSFLKKLILRHDRSYGFTLTLAFEKLLYGKRNIETV